jgi:hypothetical protein
MALTLYSKEENKTWVEASKIDNDNDESTHGSIYIYEKGLQSPLVEYIEFELM